MSKKLFVLLFLLTGFLQKQGVTNPVPDSSQAKSGADWLMEVRHGLKIDSEHTNKPLITSDLHHIKCLTPHLVYANNSGDDHSTEILRLFREFDNETIQNEEDYISPSGKFRLNFTRSGGHAVPLDDTNNSGIPDYIEMAAAYADSSYRYMVTTLGYVDPVLPGIPYLIRFREINSYGFTQSSGLTSFIVVHRNFDGFPPNDDVEGDAIGALKVTVAHEFKHAIQYATTRWQGDSGQVRWIEMDATMMEEVVFRNVNDYINYLGVCQLNACSILRDPNRSTPGSYYHATWMLYYSEAIEPEFWVDVWNEIQVSPGTRGTIESMKVVMDERNLDYDEEFTRNHLWHYNSGTAAISGYGFPDAHLFPEALNTVIMVESDSLRHLPARSRERAAQYLTIQNTSLLAGNIEVSALFNINTVGVGLLLYKSDGSVIEFVETGTASDGTGFFRFLPGVNWQSVDRVGIVFANIDNIDQDISYKLSAREIPDVLTIYPNYPNPFISRTTIPFALPETTFVSIEVYDVQGRKVGTLMNQEMSPGFYDIPFDASNLSAGLYFYRIAGGNNNLTGKMLLVK
jgi:hypothetical protein